MIALVISIRDPRSSRLIKDGREKEDNKIIEKMNEEEERII